MIKKNAVTVLFAAFFLAFLSGCASLPSPEEMQKEVAEYKLPKLPEDGKALVYMVRPSGLGMLIRFNVFIDDQEDSSEMGYTRGGQYIYFNLAPGRHKILSKAETWAEVEVTANSGDIIFIQQDPAIGIIMARNDLRRIEQQYEGKYQVKNLPLGTIKKEDK